jgi:hypothetical protein
MMQPQSISFTLMPITGQTITTLIEGYEPAI